MKKCNSCNIEFNTNEKKCPLCQNILVGESKEILFPKNIKLKTNSIILRIVLFCSISVFLISGFLELLLSNTFQISIYLGMGLLTNYAIIYFILRNYHNSLRMFGKYGLFIISLLIIWYFIIKSPIITNYIIPSVCIVELIFNSIIVVILRKHYLIKYSSQILINMFLLILPMILVALNLTTNNIMSYICCLFLLIAIAGLVIFFYDEIKEELSKIFSL